MSWQECTLGDLITLKRGHDLPNAKRIEGNIPVVSSSGVTGYHNQAKAKPPGVVTGRYGTLGEVFYLDQDYWPLNTALYVIDFKRTDPRFSAYFLKNTLKSYKSDKAAVPGVDRNVLHALKVRAPDRDTQERIAGVLSKYDEFIENNKRRIELLEESAQQLYKEWFVRFRFPGHEHVKIVDGVPEGWISTNAFKVVDVLSGGTPKTANSEFWGGDIPFFTPKDATDSIYAKKTIKNITEIGLNSCSSGYFSKDTLFITARGTVGKLNLAQVPMAMNQSCYALVGKAPLTQFFLYFALGEGIQQVKSRAVGAVFDAVIKDTFRVIPFTVPSQNLIERFTDYVSPTVRQIDVLTLENENLTAARDLLLPKLMNGEIAV